MKKKTILLFSLLMCVVLSGCCLSHEWYTASCTAPKTCVKCQKTEGEPLEHTWVDAACETPKTCQVCDAVEGEPLGHTPGEWEQISLDPITLVRERVKHCTVCEALVEEETETLTTLYEDGKFLLTCQQFYDRMHYVRDSLETKHPMSIHQVALDSDLLAIDVYNHYKRYGLYKGHDDLDICSRVQYIDEDNQTIYYDDRNSRPASIWAYAHRHDGVGATSLVILAMVLDPSLTEDSGLAVLRQALDSSGDETIHNGIRYAFTGNNDFFFLNITTVS